MTHDEAFGVDWVDGYEVWRVVMVCMELKFMHSCQKREMLRVASVYIRRDVTVKINLFSTEMEGAELLPMKERLKERNYFRWKRD